MKYRDSGELSDVTIVVEGEELQAAQNFLRGAACFKVIADFCYNKKIDISLENVAQLSATFDDIIRSAQMSRSLSPIVDLISRTACLGPAAEEAKIAERCFGRSHGRSGQNLAESTPWSWIDCWRLPLDWFERLAKSCGSEGERQLRPLAELATRYLHRQQQQNEPKEPTGEVLDRVIGSLPEPTPLAEVISGDWIRLRPCWPASSTAASAGRGCSSSLATCCTGSVRRSSKQMPSPVLWRHRQQHRGCHGRDAGASGEAQVLSGVIDNHLLDLARAGSLTAEEFANVPADYRASHDTLYEAAETLLTAGESIPDDQQKAVVEAVDLSRLRTTLNLEFHDILRQFRKDFKPTSAARPAVALRDATSRPRAYDGIGAGYSSYREPIYGTSSTQTLKPRPVFAIRPLAATRTRLPTRTLTGAPGLDFQYSGASGGRYSSRKCDQCPAGRPPIKTAEEN
uniref:NPH3 domain-containing protein n=1 Tax=Macrostomum lignano TaxID=282301 RepID=A0A1I8FJK2_9PLAT